MSETEEKKKTLQEVFDRTAELVRQEAAEGSLHWSTDDQLRLYGLYKQATAGPAAAATAAAGGSFVLNPTAAAKRRAWMACRDLSGADSMLLYVQKVIELAANEENPLADVCRDLLRNCGERSDDDGTAIKEEKRSQPVEGDSGDEASKVVESEEEDARSTKKPPKSLQHSSSTRSSFSIGGCVSWPSSWMPIVRPLIPRGQLDVSYADLAFAALQCCGTSATEHVYRQYETLIQEQWKEALLDPSADVLVGYSVRSLLDLYLRVKQFPAGSEVIVVPPLNVPGMLHVLQHHKLKIVGVDVPSADDGPVVAVDPDAVGRAMTDKTVAILTVHVFGFLTATDVDMKRLRDLVGRRAPTQQIDILEDCAQCFTGLGKEESYTGSEHADVSFFSFGLIKTSTSLGGGVAVVRQCTRKDGSDDDSRNQRLMQRMTRLHNLHYGPESNWVYFRKVCKSFTLRVIADIPLLYGFVYALAILFRLDFDRFVTSTLRNQSHVDQVKHNGRRRRVQLDDRMCQMRRRPSPAMLALLRRRISQSVPVAESVLIRRKRCRRLTQLLEEGDVECVDVPHTPKGATNSDWLYPVLSDHPERVCQYLRRRGFDATRGSSQLCCVTESSKDCPRASRLMENTLYLPVPRRRGPVGHSRIIELVRRLKTFDLEQRTRAASSQSDPASLTSNSEQIQRRPDGFLFPLLMLVLLATPHFWFAAFWLLVVGLQIASVLIVLLVVFSYLLRWTMADFYLSYCKNFAKYCYMLSSRRHHASEATDQYNLDGGGTSSILSTMKVLELDTAGHGNEGRDVFLTGATGFIGSLLLRDLLFHRKALRIDHIVVLCRPKHGSSGKDRIARLLAKQVYSFLSEEEKDFIVEVVEGDATQSNVGLSKKDLERICQSTNVTHILHAAASVSFTQSLQEAATANILSALNLQSLAGRINNPNVQFIHISTAFVHGCQSGSFQEPLPETLFPLGRFDPREIFKSMRGTQFYASKAMAELRFPNTYTFSKCVCEHLLLQSDVGTRIIRPSIVGPSLETPNEGWAGERPSTLVAACCLYLAYQWGLWAFGSHKVPCIPVDVLSRYVISAGFQESSSDRSGKDSSSDEYSSEDDFEKLEKRSKSSSSFSEIEWSDSLSPPKHRIYNAAWDAESPSSATFTWLDYAGAITQVGSVLGYFSRPAAYVGLLFATRLLGPATLSFQRFEKFHTCFVRVPFDVVFNITVWLGLDASSMRRLRTFLDLPLLFFPYMNSGFWFRSKLVAPKTMFGERYAFSCAAAAHHFMCKRRGDKRTQHRKQKSGGLVSSVDLTFLPIGGSLHKSRGFSLWWAMTNPRGNVFTRFAGWFLSKILGKCFSEVTVDATSFASAVQATSGKDRTFIVLAPTHRSFFDFLLMSYTCFCIPELQLDLPLIAAADDFEKLPVVGWLAQSMQAFFVRRGGGQDPVLTRTLGSISRRCGSSDTVIEVFIEGTRSRDRRFGEPKAGLLRCLKDQSGNLLIVPISISYEKIAEQSSLSDEAAGGVKSVMQVTAILSWLKEVVLGKVHLGRVHVSACESLVVGQPQKVNWHSLLDEIQRRQQEKIYVSSYHIKSAARLLNLEQRTVKTAYALLGIKALPISSVVYPYLDIPTDSSELCSVVLQACPQLARVSRSSHPCWSAWLNRLALPPLDENVATDSCVKSVHDALSRLFDSASSCADLARSRLQEKGFPLPKPCHVLQTATKLNNVVPGLLLLAAITNRYPRTRSPDIDVSVESGLSVAGKAVGSSEALGFWGYGDCSFVIRMDSRGTTCVTMDSDRYSLRGKRMMKLLPFFESETQLKIDPLNEAFTNAKVEEACPPSQLSAEHVEMLESIVSEFSRSTEDRIRHGTGHCQEDIFLIRGGRSMRVPDAVVWPGSEEDILAVVSEARKNGWCLIPFGGGTNVSQATRCPPIDVEPRPIISVDMRKLNKILWIDEENGLAHVQSGITGLALEEELAACGYTTGHEPDSLEFSTLGGWIATKASGMKRNKYGNIEDIVKSVRVVGPDGLLRHGREDSRACGRESCGVDLRSLMLGSEGCLGVITSAVIRIWPIPEAKDYDSVLLPSLHEGLSFVRAISRQGSRIPASVRLLDNEHFRLGLALKPDTDSLLAVFKKVLSNLYLQWRVDFNPKQVVCATFAYEGSPEEVKEQKRLVGRLLSHHGGISLGSEVGRATYDMTFMIAYLRDFAMTYHFLGESFETFAPWSQVETIIHATRERICKEHEARFLPGKPFVGCRVTQLYHEGACLYFYFCMNFENVSSASSVFSEIERAARAEILSHGGSLSHHHGVGKVRSSFLGEIDSDAHQRVMQSLKRGIDPENIFGARNGTFGRKGTLR